MKMLGKLLLVKKVITQIFVYLIIHISKKTKLIAKDLNKQQLVDVDPKAILQINFIGNLDEQETQILRSERSEKNCIWIFIGYKSIVSMFQKSNVF